MHFVLRHVGHQRLLTRVHGILFGRIYTNLRYFDTTQARWLSVAVKAAKTKVNDDAEIYVALWTDDENENQEKNRLLLTKKVRIYTGAVESLQRGRMQDVVDCSIAPYNMVFIML